jgi:hypothetical protein
MSVCASSNNNFWISRWIFIIFNTEHWRWPRPYTFKSRSFNHFKMADAETSEVGVKLEPVNVKPWNFVLVKSFLWKKKNTNVESGWILKFTFCFMEITHELLHLKKQNLVLKKITDIPTTFISVVLYDTVAMLWNLEVMLGQKLNHSLCAERWDPVSETLMM